VPSTHQSSGMRGRRPPFLPLYFLFFLSGAASLIYEIVWVRELTLVFGGSHLAVTAVLGVFMGGLALGSFLLGARADTASRPLRLYGLLECGIALCGAGFLGLMALYPRLYAVLADAADDRPIYLTSLRILFAILAMGVPTTLMGGTLPLLGRIAAERTGRLGRGLGLLYGINTLGAVAGSLMAGFVLLPSTSARTTLCVAIATNAAIGAAALALDGFRRSSERAGARDREDAAVPEARTERETGHGAAPGAPGAPAGSAMALWGIAVSGFCALGYEVLWTRTLTMVLGTSVYAFTLLLVAFLSGIGAGGAAFAPLERRIAAGRATAAFGLVQILIGTSALAVTYALRDLPRQAVRWQSLLSAGAGEFQARQAAGFLVGFTYMFVPAFFMGLAFPIAGAIRAGRRADVGSAVGEVAAWDTLGAIFGAVASGLFLIYVFGVERSLQMLCAVNLGLGGVVLLRLRSRRMAGAGAAVTASVLLLLAAKPQWLRMWDAKYFAVYRNNQRRAFDTPERVRDALENTDVLYYHEGADETVSVIVPKGAPPGYVVNGRVEASASRADRQCQLALGHLPMLLHPAPRRVFVLGLGTGITLGAVSLHPEVSRMTLAEIEPGVFGAARAFSAWNHGVLDDPRLRIVVNDGRNFLAISRDSFDVLTADPIHPWSGGASYLYTAEYYRAAASRLAPGGVACQWLPIYELSVDDLRTIVRTFTEVYPHAMLWLTHYDAELVGSPGPLVVDEARLAARMADRRVSEDLRGVDMGGVRDFLSWFVMGTEGLRAFAGDAVVNTDDNLRLEFSAPRSQGVPELTVKNVSALARFRESLLPYLAPSATAQGREAQERACREALDAGHRYDALHAAFLGGEGGSPAFSARLAELEARYPGYAPARFLRAESEAEASHSPRLLRAERFDVRTEEGGRSRTVEIAAVSMRVAETRGAVIIVDNDAREVYGQRYVDAPEEDLDAAMRRLADEIMDAVVATYAREAARAPSAIPGSPGAPPERPTLEALRSVVRGRTAAPPPPS